MERNKRERAQSQKTHALLVHTTNSTTKKTQLQVVYEELAKNPKDGITSWDMIIKHRITRTAAYICSLKKMGVNIISKDETNNGKRYSRYWLVGEE